MSDVVALGATGEQVGVISTINGDANVGFYNELIAQGVTADDIPVVAFSVGEEELSGLDTEPLVGHLAAVELLSCPPIRPRTRRSSRHGTNSPATTRG